MSKNHIDNHCSSIPAETRQKLLQLKESKRRAGGGKTYWAVSAEALGVFEDQYGLRFTKEAPDAAKNMNTSGKDSDLPFSDIGNGNARNHSNKLATTHCSSPANEDAEGDEIEH